MKLKLLAIGAFSIATATILTAPAGAQSAAQEARTLVDTTDPKVFLDNAFILVCAVLVIFMQAGFAMVESGLARAKNAAHMMLKNLMDFLVASTGFALIGYHLAFSGSEYFGFTWQWASALTAAVGAPTLTTPVHFLFNAGFAGAAATIVSGAVAERVKLKAYFIYAIAISTFVYPIVVSWVWGGGWMSRMSTPFIDLAGGTVVHVTGGTAALVGAAILGPRIGRFDAEGNSIPIPGHNIPMAILGVFILLVGWFGFNAGSLGTADLQIGMIATVTALGAGAGGLGATLASWLTVKNPDVTLIGNGVLGGLVGITAGAANLSIFGALIIGFFCGIIANAGVLLLDRARIDDPVGAVPVHMFCGIFGTLALGFLADPDIVPGVDGPAGILYGGSASVLIAQLTGVIAVVTFTAICVGTLFSVMNSLGWLRVSVEHEAEGLDLAEHASPAYNDDYVDYESSDASDTASIDAFLEELSGT